MSFLDSLAIVLLTAIGSALLYMAVQLGRGRGRSVVDTPDRLTVRATPLPLQAAQLSIALLLPGTGLLLLAFGASRRFYLMIAAGGLLVLLFGGGALLYFWHLFDRATLIDKQRREIRRGRQHTTVEALASVRLDRQPRILYAWAYPCFTVSLVSQAEAALPPDEQVRAAIAPFHAIFSSRDPAKASAVAALLARRLGLPLEETEGVRRGRGRAADTGQPRREGE